MESEILKLYNSFESHIDIGMSKDIQIFFKERKDVKGYNIQEKNNIVIVDVKLVEFSIGSAKNFFYDLVKFVSYMEMNISISERMDKKIKYMFFTSMDGLKGTKIEVTIE